MNCVRSLLVLPFLFSSLAAFAEIKFSAELDRAEIGLDETVSLKLTIENEGSTQNVAIEQPKFQSPDFDTVQTFQNTMIQSYYENGKFGMRNTQNITSVLKPNKTGRLSITQIQLKAGGKVYSAPNLDVQVLGSGGGTPPSNRYGGSGIGLRGTVKKADARPFLIKAETSEATAYKGQQIIVSYYLYRRSRVFNISVRKFPAFAGFLKEDLEIPVMTQLNFTPTQLDGVSYDRALLARYAVYPLKEGALKLDAMGLTASYFPPGRRGGMGDEEDDPFFQFFRQVNPQNTQMNSDPITLTVKSLPDQGKPNPFSGGVGNFKVTASTDKVELKADEAVTLNIRVEGRGNVASIEAPPVEFPKGLDLYESKNYSKSGVGAVGEKTFEYLLIPRQRGEFVLPSFVFNFFDPKQGKYVSESTPNLKFNVTTGPAVAPVTNTAPPPAATSASAPNAANPGEEAAPATEKKSDIRYLKTEHKNEFTFQGHPWWRWTFLLASLSVLLFCILVLKDLLFGKPEPKLPGQKDVVSFSKLKEKLSSPAPMTSKEMVTAYDEFENLLFSEIDIRFAVSSRGIPRAELGQQLISRNVMTEAQWKEINTLFEHAEFARYASQSAHTAKDLISQISQAEVIFKTLK